MTNKIHTHFFPRRLGTNWPSKKMCAGECPFPLAASIIKITIVLYSCTCGLGYAAGPLPTGGRFSAGSGTITGDGKTVTVNQLNTSSRGIVDWKSFSIGAGNKVVFNNGGGTTLNIVSGGAQSVILGSLIASGGVYLLNPQGVLVGSTGTVTTGGRFVASTLGIDRDAFMAGSALNLSGDSNAEVINLGKIASSNGDVFLISRTIVFNQGSISAPNGTAELVAGKAVLVQDSSSDRQVFVLAGSNGSVINLGSVRAAQINLQAADGNVYALAGNHDPIRATGTSVRNGHVWLVADGGAVTQTGDIRSSDLSGGGGIVDTSAKTVSYGFSSVDSPTVTAGEWNISSPTVNVNGTTANAVARSLNAGTATTVRATAGDLQDNGSIKWYGSAPLTLVASHSVSIGSGTTVKNTGAANLSIRADADAMDNAGSIINKGTVDWSSSLGIVSAAYDINGIFSAGSLLNNHKWAAQPNSGEVAQISVYKLVNSESDLRSVTADLTGNFMLGRDVNGTSSFPAIGSASSPFVGQFEGGGHSVSVAAAPTSYDAPFGLFSVIGKAGVVRNMNVNGRASYDDGMFGVLAGVNYGTVTNVRASGTAEAGHGIAAGLVATNYGTISRSSATGSFTSRHGMGAGLVASNYGTVSQSSSSATTSGVESAGLVGDNQGLISQSYATGNTAGSTAGGLVSTNSGTIVQSYSTGAVSVYNGYAGSLVGRNNATGVISESYATGATTGYYNLGGITGSNEGKINKDVYWNKETTGLTQSSGVNTAVDLSAGNGLTTIQMMSATNFKRWDFSKKGTWVMPVGAEPVLRWQTTQ